MSLLVFVILINHFFLSHQSLTSSPSPPLPWSVLPRQPPPPPLSPSVFSACSTCQLIFCLFLLLPLSSAEADPSRSSSSSLYMLLCPAVTLSLNQPSSYRRPQRRKKQWSITLPQLPESLSSVISGVDVWAVRQSFGTDPSHSWSLVTDKVDLLPMMKWVQLIFELCTVMKLHSSS